MLPIFFKDIQLSKKSVVQPHHTNLPQEYTCPPLSGETPSERYPRANFSSVYFYLQIWNWCLLRRFSAAIIDVLTVKKNPRPIPNICRGFFSIPTSVGQCECDSSRVAGKNTCRYIGMKSIGYHTGLSTLTDSCYNIIVTSC